VNPGPEKILSFLSKERNFCEARLEKLKFFSILHKDGEFRANSGSEEGASVRVFRNGCWGFASGRLSEFPELLRKAKKLASAGKGKLKLMERGTQKGKPPKAPQSELGADGLLPLCKELKKELEGGRITNTGIKLLEERGEERYFNSLGDECAEETLVLYGRFSAVGKKNGVTEEGLDRFSSLEKWNADELHSRARAAKRRCLQALDASPAKAGEFPVVMDNELAGVFAHEAVGHACEADAVIEGTSILRDKRGVKIGSELVTIWDDPALKEGFGRYFFDGEGVRGKKVILIEKGVVSGYMNSVETAAVLSEKPNGHARSESYSCAPIVRMSNTCIEPGKQKIEELLEMKDGLYLKGMSGGSVEPFTGQFMFRCVEAFRVRNGEVGERLRGVAITGTIMDTLKGVDALSRDFETSPGFCGKDGQSVRVSDGGPHVRVSKIRVG
jgi:TldD protein